MGYVKQMCFYDNNAQGRQLKPLVESIVYVNAY